MYNLRYSSTAAALGKRGVSGGKGKPGNDTTGCGRFVVRESYMGITGGVVEVVGSAGSLVTVISDLQVGGNEMERDKQGRIQSEKETTHQTPQTSSLASNTVTSHSPFL
jgi:hypothetical protein